MAIEPRNRKTGDGSVTPALKAVAYLCLIAGIAMLAHVLLRGFP